MGLVRPNHALMVAVTANEKPEKVSRQGALCRSVKRISRAIGENGDGMRGKDEVATTTSSRAS